MVIYNPLSTAHKSTIGAVKEGDNLRLCVNHNGDYCNLLIKKDGESDFTVFTMQKNHGVFSVNISLPIGLYWYCFDIDNGRKIVCGENLNGIISDYISKCFQLSVYDKNYAVPQYVKGGVIYQIFPDRFYRGEKEKTVSPEKVLHQNWYDIPTFEPNEYGEVLNNDFFGGDIRGIIEKLDYLKELNVSIIYLNPIFKAYSNHRYDTGDYMTIDPLLGTEQDFIELLEKADSMGIKIILDGVFNHAGSDSLYFNKEGRYDSLGAYQSENSPYSKWFNFIKFPNEYQSWWGIKTLPAYNKNCQEFIDYLTGKDGVIEKYTKLGIGGWRLDVVDEIPAHIVKEIRNAVKRNNNDAIIIGEVWEDASNKVAYGVRREYFLGKELDSVMNYPLKNAIINFAINGADKQLVQTINEQIDHYPKMVLDSLMNMLSTHDTYRILSALSNFNTSGMTKKQMSTLYASGERLNLAKKRLKIATLLQFTLMGVPSIYYGDEIGMQGLVDPLNRLGFAWGKEDFEIYNWYKKLSDIRTSYSAFADGEFNLVYANNGTIVFTRTNDESQVLVCANAGKTAKTISFDGELYNLIDQTNYMDKFELQVGEVAVFIKK